MPILTNCKHTDTMNRIATLLSIAFVVVGCMSPTYPSIDVPSGGTDASDRQIIDYIDKRLEEEYYWLDEVMERGGSFNRTVQWEKYLNNSLQRLTTNADDGYVNAKGQRIFYSYIRDVNGDTRTATSTTGFGLGLYYTIISLENNRLAFVINNVYEGSPAAAADLRRGDMIISVNGAEIDHNNYATLFNLIEYNTATELRLIAQRQTAANANEASIVATLQKGSYMASPVAYHTVITVPNSQKRIGYLVYTAFDNDYDDDLLEALAMLAAEGVDSFILDLRTNGGGHVSSAVKLCSALVGVEYVGATLTELRRNPANKTSLGDTINVLEDVGVDLGLDELTVICSDYSASASELVVMGLRGLDIPVTLIGTTTEGKNCGMDVTRRTFGNTTVEYAPITFMCYNAKGFGSWGEGITPDIDLSVDNKLGVKDEYFPMPRSSWGDLSYDIGLAAAVASITGKKVSTATPTATRSDDGYMPAMRLERPFVGTLYEVPEQ